MRAGAAEMSRICRDAVELRQVELGDVEKDVVSQTMVFLLQAVAGEQTRKLFFGQVRCGYVQVDEVSGEDTPMLTVGFLSDISRSNDGVVNTAARCLNSFSPSKRSRPTRSESFISIYAENRSRPRVALLPLGA